MVDLKFRAYHKQNKTYHDVISIDLFVGSVNLTGYGSISLDDVVLEQYINGEWLKHD